MKQRDILGLEIYNEISTTVYSIGGKTLIRFANPSLPKSM